MIFFAMKYFLPRKLLSPTCTETQVRVAGSPLSCMFGSAKYGAQMRLAQLLPFHSRVGFLHPLGTPAGRYAACVPTFVTPVLVQRVYNGSEKQIRCSGKCCCFDETGCTLLLQFAKQKGIGRRRTFKSQNWISFIFIFLMLIRGRKNHATAA